MKRFLAGIVLMCLSFGVMSEKLNEDFYNTRWCEEKGGQREFQVFEEYSERMKEAAGADRWLVGRVDCLTEEYAVEADWSYKWKEAIGQSLLYADITGKKPAILLILSGDRVADYRDMVRIRTALKHVKHKGRTPVKVFYIGTEK